MKLLNNSLGLISLTGTVRFMTIITQFQNKLKNNKYNDFLKFKFIK